MEKRQPPEQKKPAKNPSSDSANRKIWDCGSSLYDSFELQALEKQLDSAISSRSLSMPHLSDRRRPPPPPVDRKPSSKISQSFQRLVRAVFRPKDSSSGDKNNRRGGGGGFYGFYDRAGGALSTIPEGLEFDGLSPEMRSAVTRTASERFTAAASVGIFCK